MWLCLGLRNNAPRAYQARFIIPIIHLLQRLDTIYRLCYEFTGLGSTSSRAVDGELIQLFIPLSGSPDEITYGKSGKGKLFFPGWHTRLMSQGYGFLLTTGSTVQENEISDNATRFSAHVSLFSLYFYHISRFLFLGHSSDVIFSPISQPQPVHCECMWGSLLFTFCVRIIMEEMRQVSLSVSSN